VKNPQSLPQGKRSYRKKADYISFSITISIKKKTLYQKILPSLLLALVFTLTNNYWLTLYNQTHNILSLSPISSSYNKPILEQMDSLLFDLDKTPVKRVAAAPAPEHKVDGVVFHGSRTVKRVALTFDADMNPYMKSLFLSGKVENYYDQALIDILISTRTKATLFLSGMWVELYPEETKQLSSNPLFELANHSYSHPSFHGECYGLGEIPDSQTQEEVQKAQDLLKSVANVENSLFRFPGGCYSQKDIEVLNDMGIIPIQWDVEGKDGFNDNAAAIENNILANVKNGSIIVLHMNGIPNEPKTAEVMPKIISTLREEGFEFVKVSELLNVEKKHETMDIQQHLTSRYGL